MKYRISRILSMALALPLMLVVNISQGVAATTNEDKMDVGNQAIENNPELNLLVAEALVEAVDNWLELDGQFPTILSLEEFKKESQQRFLIGDDYQSKDCRRYGICES